MPHEDDAAIPDRMIPDPKTCEIYSITPMTLWRWRRDPKIAYPKPVKIGDRNYTPLAADRAFRARMVRQGITAGAAAASDQAAPVPPKGRRRKQHDAERAARP